MKSRVLVVEDEEMVAEVLGHYLSRNGHVVRWVSDGEAALGALEDFAPDLIVLDVMLPGVDGFEVCRRVRERTATPIMIVSARRHEYDRLHGLGIGADDYVTKPFSPREVVARAQAILRRTNPEAARDLGPIVHGDLVIDPRRRLVTCAGAPCELTPREFDILAFLARNPHQVFSRVQMLEAVWGPDFEGDEDTVTVHVRRLRAKIEEEPSAPR